MTSIPIHIIVYVESSVRGHHLVFRMNIVQHIMFLYTLAEARLWQFGYAQSIPRHPSIVTPYTWSIFQLEHVFLDYADN